VHYRTLHEWNTVPSRRCPGALPNANVPVKATDGPHLQPGIKKFVVHLSNEGGPLEDPWNEPPTIASEWTTETRKKRPNREL